VNEHLPDVKSSECRKGRASMINHLHPLSRVNALPRTADIWDDIIIHGPPWLDDPFMRCVFLCLARVVDALQEK